MNHDEKVARKAAHFGPMYGAQYIRATHAEVSPRTAIKLFCIECMGYSPKDARACSTTECPIYRYMRRNGAE
jgi:hypothetical protein